MHSAKIILSPYVCTDLLCAIPQIPQKLTARAPWSREPSRDREARPRGAQALAPARSRATGARRAARAAIGLGLELGDSEAAHVELSIAYPASMSAAYLPSASTSAAYLPSISTSAAYHPSVSTSQAQYRGTSAMQSALHEALERSHAGRPVSSSSLARL